MKDHRNYFAIDQMAQILGVSKSGYYDYLKRPPSLRERYNEELLYTIKNIFKESYETWRCCANQ